MQTVKHSFGSISIVLFISACFILNSAKCAPKPRGIFKSANDFDRRTLTFVSTATCKYKIKCRHFFKSKTVRVITNDTIFFVCKDSIYGYQDRKGVAYRFYDNTAYTIIYHDSSFVVYKLNIVSSSKYQLANDVYYFSKHSNCEMMPLTLQNINKVYQIDQIFYLMMAYYFNDHIVLASDDLMLNIKGLSQLLQVSKNN